MKSNIPFPVMFKGKPKRRRLPSDLYIHTIKNYEIDIPSVSENETFQALHPDQDKSSDGSVFPELKIYDGNIYKRYSFEVEKSILNTGALSHNGSISYPIYKQIFWTHALLGLGAEANMAIWPKKCNGCYSPEHIPPFYQTLPLLSSFNEVDIAQYDRMNEIQANKLLMIDGETWIKTPPPCISIYPSLPHRAVAKNSINIKFEYYPDFQDLDFGVVRFPITKLGDALQYAAELATKVGAEFRVGDLPEFDTQLIDSFYFELGQDDDDEIFRFALVLASNLVRREAQHLFPSLYKIQTGPLFAGDENTCFQSIKNEVLKTNMMIGERGNLEEMIPEILELWQSTRRISYQGLQGIIGESLNKTFDMAHDRANAILEDRPINIETFLNPNF